VSSENVFLCLLEGPTFTISEGAFKTVFMSLLNDFAVVFREAVAANGILKEESVVHVSGGMGLRLEERIKVPEGRFDEPISWHLVESHLEQSLSELSSHFQKWV
jgi:hypothetical protein